jgi:hypothetical protein
MPRDESLAATVPVGTSATPHSEVTGASRDRARTARVKNCLLFTMPRAS